MSGKVTILNNDKRLITKNGAKCIDISLGTFNGVEHFVNTFQGNLCKDSIEMFRKEAKRVATLTATQERLRKRLAAKEQGK